MLMRAMYKFPRGMGDITDAERHDLDLAADATKFSIVGHRRSKHTEASVLGPPWLRLHMPLREHLAGCKLPCRLGALSRRRSSLF